MTPKILLNVIMSNTNVLGEIKCFLGKSSPKPLEIVFAALEIQTFVKGRLLNTTTKKLGRIRVCMAEQNGIPYMEVLDHLVFRFSFYFPWPEVLHFFESTALDLPRPLVNGLLKIDSEKLQLGFTIDAPDENLIVQVKHSYTNALHLKKIGDYYPSKI